MSEVLVRNLDEAVVEQLKARARGSGRSLQAELKLILEQAARPAPAPARPSRAAYRALADQVRAALGDGPQADSAALLAEDRAR
jgi:plasmid stability protein